MINRHAIRIEALTESDLQQNAVWAYTTGDKVGNIFVRPLKTTPVSNLDGKVVGAQILLANGKKVWSLIGNIDLQHPVLTYHFITLSVLRKGKWFVLARYHDFDYKQRGPHQLATFLGLKVNDVFPIKYDISAYAKGDHRSLAGIVEKEPKHTLTRAEIIALAVPHVPL